MLVPELAVKEQSRYPSRPILISSLSPKVGAKARGEADWDRPILRA